jgi:hypothetical protein
MLECIWVFWFSVASLCTSIGALTRLFMLRLTDPEEPPTKELDPDYTDDLGDDLPGATPHPLVDPITHCK